MLDHLLSVPDFLFKALAHAAGRDLPCAVHLAAYNLNSVKSQPALNFHVS